MLLLDLVYFAGAPVALPVLALKAHRTGKYRSGLAERFGLGNEGVPSRRGRRGRRLLLHAVSVGELNSVQTLIARLLAADPQLEIVVSTGTDTGTERARKLFGGSAEGGEAKRVFAVRFPFDFSFAVERLLDRVDPDAVALVELETWPNFLAIAHSRRIPVVLINGRISERSFPRYRLIRPLMAAMLGKVRWIGAQTAEIAWRFVELGAAEGRVEVLPTLKYDNVPAADGVLPGEEALGAAMGLEAGHRLVVAGSIGPGEEAPVLDAYVALRGKYPELRLAMVPRHPENIPQAIASIEARGLRHILRTKRPDGGVARPAEGEGLRSEEVFVLNTMGELRKLYGLCFGAFIGRSLVKLGGSDMIEAAALGKPVCFGPYTHNFPEVVELLAGGEAAKVVHDTRELTETLDGWLRDPAGAGAMGERARRLLEQQKGSTERYVEKLMGVLRESAARRGR
jgi:3-deoxy-D-manno-octulosonic-acid transferase